MGRLLVTILLGLGLFGLVAWYFNLPVPNPDPDRKSTNAATAELGGVLYPEIPLPALPHALSRAVDPILINGQVAIIDKREISAELDGTLLFVGEEVPDGTIAVSGAAAFMVEPFQFFEMKIGEQTMQKFYREIKEGSTVRPGQMLAMLNPAKILSEREAKRAKVTEATAEYEAAKATFEEADSRLQRKRDLYLRGAIAAEEYNGAVLAQKKCRFDADAKKEAIKLAKAELKIVEIALGQHFIRNPIMRGNSTVKTIVRQGGETVKHMEPLIQLYNVDRLRAEGMVDVQYQKSLWQDMPVVIAPAYLDSPSRVLYAHRQEITSVAVSKNVTATWIVSASKDKTVCVWNLKQAGPKDVLFHPDAVTVVACAPPKSARSWMVSGCVDGSIRIWNMDDLSNPRILENAHEDGVTALAFSPDGKWFASGGNDNNICLWDTETGKKKYSFGEQGDPHQGAVTSLAFTPQCRLVSASRDNTLHVWKLHEKGPELEHDAIAGRGGIVSQLGVSDDGRWMLFDQGKSLQVLSVADGRTMGVLQKPSDATPFETVAIFSPDSSLILTAGASEGRLQLWKTPTPSVRGFEVRQLLPEEGAAVTCAVFAPNAGLNPDPEESFAVSGDRDGNVYVWHIPTAEDVDRQRISNARLTLIERALDSGVRQMRVGVELRDLSNHPRLIPGLPVTIGIDPR